MECALSVSYAPSSAEAEADVLLGSSPEIHNVDGLPRSQLLFSEEARVAVLPTQHRTLETLAPRLQVTKRNQAKLSLVQQQQ